MVGKMLTRNQSETNFLTFVNELALDRAVFRVLTDRWVAVEGCAISVAAIFSGLRRPRGNTPWPGLKSRAPSIGAMGCAMQATPPMRSGQ